MLYDPEGPVAKQLLPLLKVELTNTYGIPDDALDVADYINVLIGNNRSASDICAEVKEVVNIPIDESFVGRVFAEITRLDSATQQAWADTPMPQPHVPEPAAQAPMQSQQPQAQSQQPQPFQPQTFQPLAFQPSVFPGPNAAPPTEPKGARMDFQANEARRATPQGPKGARAKGVSKDYNSNSRPQKKSFGLKNAANLEKALSMSSTAQSVNMAPYVPRAPKGRCRDHPHCKDRDCQYLHPTKKCFAFPNCPNPAGTCDYLHPAEDGDLMEELDRSRRLFADRRKERIVQPQVTLCKYGILCSKELCPFGHPTPANRDAKVIIPKWCRENKNCQNESCQYAHSSPNYQAPVQTPPPQQFVKIPNAMPSKFGKPPAKFFGYNKRTPTTLEQCKFGLHCTNQMCPKRHSTSAVACRGANNCTRLDCTFNHPIEEDCRFANECKNKFCYYRHPDGREKLLFSGGDSTGGRSFAVPEDQVMELVVQQ